VRFALIVSRVPQRAEVTGFPLDAEAILAADHDMEVFTDLDGAGAEMLRRSGVPVTVAPKRGVHSTPEGERRSDRETVAEGVLASHTRRSFDALLYGENIPVDLAWYRGELGEITRGFVLGAGPLSGHRLVFDHPELAGRHVYEVWRAAGSLAASSFVVSDAPLFGFGLREGGPPRFVWSGPPASRPELTADPRLVVVVARDGMRAEYGTLIERAAGAVEVGPHTLVVAVVPDVGFSGESVGELLLAGAPAGLGMQVVVAHPGRDGVAAAHIARADVIVTAGPADTAVPAVREAKAPVVELGAGLTTAPRLGSVPLPARAPGSPRVAVSVPGTPSGVVAAGDEAVAGGAGLIVLHTPGEENVAAWVAGMPGLEGADIVVLGPAEGAFGEPAAHSVVPGLVAVSARVWPSVRRRMARAEELPEVIASLIDPTSVEHASLAVLPEPGTPRAVRLRPDRSAPPAWLASYGLVGAPDRSRADLPGRAARREAVERAVRAWVMKLPWAQRLRLALPTRWGLLRRAMRGRW
jgi:hypothetical protein